MDTITHPDPRSLTGDAAARLEADCQSRIAAWWDRAGLTAAFPAADGEVVRLLRAVEYAITPETLVRHIMSRRFAGPAVSDDRRNWLAADIVRLASFCEARRDWQVDSPLHASKVTSYQRALDHARRDGSQHDVFDDLDQHDLRSITLLMVEADSRQQREALFVALQILCDQQGIDL